MDSYSSQAWLNSEKKNVGLNSVYVFKETLYDKYQIEIKTIKWLVQILKL